MTDYRIISADSHFVEPPNMWVERIDPKFRDRAPRTVKGHKGKEGEFFVCENITPIPYARPFGAGVKAEDFPEHNKKGVEAAPASVWDPAARLKEQDIDGVKAEVLYTTFGMLLFGLDDAELRAACFRAFNDWAAEYCSHDPKRLIGLGVISLEDIPTAAAELERIAKKGLHGALIWGAPPEDKPYSLPDYDPFWAAAQDLQMPLSLHIGTGRGGVRFNLPRRGAELYMYMKVPQEIQLSFADLIVGGVLERFPRLKLVSAENDISWIPHFMYRLDHAYERLRHFEGLTLSMLPSEYMKRNVVATFQFESANVDFTRQVFGAEHIAWASDYPHNDSTWPRSQEFIARAF
ncbi:MAG TPA: amidohydrolase family protein, partial [Candidatus Binatia bacterium]|nr:amidohydrolase family protein [Candidatus Binatia bacterium]